MLATSILEIATFFGIWATVWLPIAWSIALSIHWQPQQPLTVKQKLILLASLYILAPIVLWWKFPSQELSFAAVGLSWQLSLWASLGLGLTLGVVSLAIIFSGESWLGLVSWHWQNSRLLLPPILPILGLSLGISLVEELVFRGYVLDTLLADYSYWMGGAISSLIFALLHLIWERKTTVPQLPGLWLMGMILVGARLVDRGSLGLAWGLHTGWIWGLTCLDSAQLITYNDTAKSWLVGINRQPLAGVAGVSCLLATGLALWLLQPYWTVH